MSLDDLLFDEGRDGAEVLIHSSGRDATRDEVRAAADRIAASLERAGVRRGDAVAAALTDGIDVTAALFGVWRAGAVYVPVNPRSSEDEVHHVIESTEPAAAIVETGGAARFPATSPGSSVPTSGDRPVQVAPLAASGPRRSHPEGVAIISFTSGTTGKPKPVLLLHDGVLELLDGVLRSLRTSSTRTDGHGPGRRSTLDPARLVNLVPVSLSLWAGLYNLLFGMRTGALIVTMDRFVPAEFARLVRDFAIRSTVLPPAAMAMLADDPSIDDLSPLRYVRSITAPLSPFQARRFVDRFGIGVLNGYGQTEIGGEIMGWTAADLRRHPDKVGSVGRPHAGVELRIVADDGGEADDGAVGELWARTPALSAGYADGGDLTDRLSTDRYFRTGDLARIDAEGFVWIEGRVSDMINRGGLKVFPADVEEVLRVADGILDAAVVGVPDDRLGEVPWAFLEGEAELDDRALEQHCRQHLAPYKVPVRFEHVRSLPRNEVGKVLKRDLLIEAARRR